MNWKRWPFFSLFSLLWSLFSFVSHQSFGETYSFTGDTDDTKKVLSCTDVKTSEIRRHDGHNQTRLVKDQIISRDVPAMVSFLHQPQQHTKKNAVKHLHLDSMHCEHKPPPVCVCVCGKNNDKKKKKYETPVKEKEEKKSTRINQCWRAESEQSEEQKKKHRNGRYEEMEKYDSIFTISGRSQKYTWLISARLIPFKLCEIFNYMRRQIASIQCDLCIWYLASSNTHTHTQSKTKQKHCHHSRSLATTKKKTTINS